MVKSNSVLNSDRSESPVYVFKPSKYDLYFIKKIQTSIPGLTKKEIKECNLRYSEIYANESNNLQDEKTQSFIILASYILAMYESLSVKNLGDDEIIARLSELLIKCAGGNYIKWLTKIMLWVKRDKKKWIIKSSLDAKKMYGSFLDMSEDYGVKKFSSIVHRCGFHEFFLRQGHPQLTQIFCKWDNVWANEINSHPCKIRFERTETIAQGNDTCRFEFNFES